jgi:branched-chain amino acid transport system ATP-binding protein
MLELKNVHTHYGLSHILQGVNLGVNKGEVVGLFGRNGVGKTTVMKTVAGWVKPSQGEVLFEGQSLAGFTSDQISRMGIGLVPEDRRIFPGLTVEENLRLGFLQAPLMGSVEKRSKLDDIFQRFPLLAERRKQMGTTLSGGEQQMLAIARVLTGRPRLLLIDEPTEGLAPIIVLELVELMQRLANEGLAILLVEQNIHLALKLSQRFYLMERGQIELSGRSDDELSRSNLLSEVSV